MKNNLRLFIMFVALGLILTFSMAAFGQKVGGYKTVPTDDATIVSAAEFAIARQAKTDETEMSLRSVETAASQVVAGTNYKLCLQVNAGGEGETGARFAQVVVFYSLKREFNLTGWAFVDDCGKLKKAADSFRKDNYLREVEEIQNETKDQ